MATFHSYAGAQKLAQCHLAKVTSTIKCNRDVKGHQDTNNPATAFYSARQLSIDKLALVVVLALCTKQSPAFSMLSKKSILSYGLYVDTANC